jgi:hypothetical protein
MKKKTLENILLVTVIIFVAVGVVVLIVRNQKTGTQNTPQKVTNNVQETPQPQETAIRNEASSMVTQLSQIFLSVTSPKDNATVTSSKVSIKGVTRPKAEVYVNESEGTADSSGNFSLSIALDEGENPVIVTAVDADGNVAETALTVTYDVGGRSETL